MKYLLIISFLFLGLSACSDYAKILKGADYSQKFVTANELYEKKEYDKIRAAIHRIKPSLKMMSINSIENEVLKLVEKP